MFKKSSKLLDMLSLYKDMTKMFNPIIIIMMLSTLFDVIA